MTRRALNLDGQKFGRALVIGTAPRREGDRRAMMRCRCDCGTEFTVASSVLVTGGRRSCGCLRREQASKNACAALAKGRATQALRRAADGNTSFGAHAEAFASERAYRPAPTWHGIEEAARDLAAALGLLGAPA